MTALAALLLRRRSSWRPARWAAAVVLGALALALNRVEVSVLTEETPQFVFGGSLVLVAFVLLGAGPGLLAAAISIMLLVAGDADVGWLTVVYVLEAWVAYLLWQRWRSLVLGVLCFWLTCGWLLDVVLYQYWIGLQPAYVMLLFVKQLFNGLLNATLAEGLLYVFELLPLGFRRLFARARPPEPLRAFVFNRLVFVLVLPALAVASLYARTAYHTQLASTQAEQLQQAGNIADELRALVEEWHRESANAVRGLVESGWSVSSQPGVQPWRERRPELLGLGRTDAEGRVVESVAAWPGLEPLLSPEAMAPGTLAAARDLGQTIYLPVRMARGRGDASEPDLLPVLTVVEPRFAEGRFEGVETFLLDGRSLRPLLDRAALHGSDTIVLFDTKRSVIAAVGLALPAGTPVATLVPTVDDLEDSGARTLSFYGPPAASLESQLGIDRHYAAFYPVRPLGYGLLVGQSSSHLYQEMIGASARVVGFLVALLALSYAVVVWVGRRIGEPLHAVHAAAADIAAGRSEDAGTSLRRLVASPIEEIRVTASHLEEMRGTLAQKETGREERLRLAADIARLVTLEWEPATDKVVAGGRAREVFGGTPPADRQQLAARIDPRDRERVMAELERLATHRRRGVLEFRITGSPRDAARADSSDSGDGEVVVTPVGTAREATRWLAARAEAIGGEDGQVARVLCVATDVTEQRRAEAALRESEERYRALFDNVPVGIGLTDGRGNLVAFNDAMLRQGGFARSDIGAGTSIADFYDDSEDRRMLLAELERNGYVRQREVRFRRKDGGTFVGVVSLQRVELDGEPFVLAMVEDTTARRQLQEQLLRAQKLEAVGRLSGGLAHDFNNLVTVILGCTELALKGIAVDDPRRTLLNSVGEAGRRAAELTRQLLAFSRRQVVQPRRVDLSDLVLGFDRMLRRFLGEHIELVTRPGAELWACRVDPGQLEQVLVNLVLNARDAMPSGGVVTIATANLGHRHEDPRYPQMPLGDYVSLSVSDTGVGMSPEVLAQVFEPFFTTKPAGEGTGLGLATCYGIVKQAGGYIWARSRQNAGATIEVLLPRAEGRVSVEPQRAGAAASAPRGSERVLLVEDEPAVNRLAERVLRDLGYTVQAAWSGEEASGMLDRNGEIDLLLTDVRLPRRSGTDLAEEVRLKQPGAKILFMSGYVEELRGAFAEDGVAFLAKPFSPGDLAFKVRSVLDASEDRA